jgi:hypothetical protein
MVTYNLYSAQEIPVYSMNQNTDFNDVLHRALKTKL